MDSNRIAEAGEAQTGAMNRLEAHLFTSIDEFIYDVVHHEADPGGVLRAHGMTKLADLLDLP